MEKHRVAKPTKKHLKAENKRADRLEQHRKETAHKCLNCDNIISMTDAICSECFLREMGIN